ncbi:MAG: ABC transporter ATP-binding protein [Caldiserica bacterium]|nr:ABC transporter ATP-binding protein [Caldisericota bacterium]
MIQVRGITKYYGNFLALKGISFSVKKGEILGFLGPNAAGKTTTLRVISGFFPPNEGEIKIGGLDIFENAREIKKRIGYLPENPPIYPEMRVKDYLNFVAEIKGVPRKERKQKVDMAIEATGLTSVSHRILSHVSRGYKQRTGLAASLVNDPEVLLLDEPTSGLDPKQIIEIRELIKSWRGKRTIILSSHILPEVEATSDRVVIIDQGEIKAEGTPETLSHKISQGLKYFLKLKNFSPSQSEIIKKIRGVKKVKVSLTDSLTILEIEAEADKDIREEIFHRIVEGKGIILEFRPIEITLEDIFLRLTTRE